jgi:hypothetical protein
VQRTVGLAAAARGADVIVDIGICHGSLLMVAIGYDRDAIEIIGETKVLRKLQPAVP